MSKTPKWMISSLKPGFMTYTNVNVPNVTVIVDSINTSAC